MKYQVKLQLPPSSNHIYVRGRYLNKRASEWMAQARDKCLAATGDWSCQIDRKVVVELVVYWPDNRRRDCHNLHKLLADVLEGIVVNDDRWMLLRDMDFSIDREEPRIEITAYEKD